MKFPWTKRAELAALERKEAEEKCETIRKDWTLILRHKKVIFEEVALNDWTSTAIEIFSGKGLK